MATLIVPSLDEEPWPTLGPQVCDFIEAYGRYGPGDLEGKPYELTEDFRAQIYRAYEVYPKSHPKLAGRRRFKRVCFEERKGTAKTERAMEIAFAESHPDAPVRCDGFRKVGSTWEPVGRGMRSPYIPLVSYTVEQTEDLGFAVLRSIIESSDLVDDYDISLERILVLGENRREAGKIVALAGSPGARDGAKTTFQHFDEPHRMTLPRAVKAHSTMLENTYKRVMADAWTLETTTAGEPGEESVAEDTRAYAEQVQQGKVDDPRLFFFSRFAPSEMPMETPQDVMAALVEASPKDASWSADLDALVARWFEPKTDQQFYRRVWLNQWVQGGSQAFDMTAWAAAYRSDAPLERGELVTAGFDGAVRRDTTALVLTSVPTGLQVVAGIWARPDHASPDWEVPRSEVTHTLKAVDSEFELWRLYADPYKWGPWLDEWAGILGEKRVQSWSTTRVQQVAYACRNYATAIRNRELGHAGDPVLTAHVGNARRVPVPFWDEEQQQLWRISKDRPDSEKKIDAAMAGLLSWECRGDALAAGAKKAEPVFVPRRVR